ncbi:STAS domain-containing protein [Pseudosporangium ferrugineum]|nr:STAS domain-containing protein [Pseudosporangium ferrugineum]
MLRVTTHDRPGGVRVLCLSGEIDHDSVEALRAAVEQALAEGRDRLVVELSTVAFCDSAGLSLFVEAHRRTAAAGGWFRLAAPTGAVRYVLDATNLGDYLGVYEDADSAAAG